MSKIENCFFIGSKKLGLACLNLIYSMSPKILKGIVTINDSNDSRSAFRDFKKFASSNHVQLHVVSKRKEFDDLIRQHKPQLCLVVGWYWIISKEILDIIPYGTIGLHASLLPKYRGGAPLVWAMINGETGSGITMFYFAEGMDSGLIIAQKRIPIGKGDYICTVLEKAEVCALSLLEKYYPKVLDKTAKTYMQKDSQATYCAQRRPEDGLIKWDILAKEIYNFIRAQSKPYPGAFTFMNHKKLYIWEATPLERVYFGNPGQVVNINSDGVLVIGGDNKPLLVKTVQIEGGKVYPANRVIKSIQVRF